MDVISIIKGVFPEATDADCEHILWGRTPYPFAPVTARDLYRAAMGLKRAGANGRRLCDYCANVAEQGRYECSQCRAALTPLPKGE